MVLFLLRPDNIMPILVRVPVSSKMIFQRYMTRLIGKMIPVSGVVIALYKFDGFYLYASTEEILGNALKKLNLSKYSRVSINCGDILKLDSNGAVEIGRFDFCEDFYGRYYLEPDENYLEELAFVYGIEQEDILTLLDYGFGVFDIEEILCSPEIMQEYLDEVNIK